MAQSDVSRRALLKGGGAMAAGWSVFQVSGSARALAGVSPPGDDVVAADGRVDPENIGPRWGWITRLVTIA